MPDKPDYPDWTQTEKIKEEKKKPRRAEPEDLKYVGVTETGAARTAGKKIKENRERTEKIYKELFGE